jgi:hypothetical protein
LKRKVESLTEFLFSEDREDEESVGYLPIEVDQTDIEKVHHTYIQSLINVYEKLKKHYRKVIQYLPSQTVQTLIEDKDKKFQIEPPKLVITHEAP